MSNPTVASTVGFPGNHFEQALLEVAIARDVLADAADFVRTQAPVPQGVGINHATDDPHVILRFGQFRARLHAAEGLLARASHLANASGFPVPATAPPPTIPTAATSPTGLTIAPSPAAPTPAIPTAAASPTGLTIAPSPAAPAPAIPTAAASPTGLTIAPSPAAPATAPAAPSAPPLSPPTVLVALLEARAFANDLVAEITAQLIAWGGPLHAAQKRRDATAHLGPHTATHWNYHHAGNYYLKAVAPPTPEPHP
ncbi:MAG: hypothetical protein ACJ8R9_03395 [Steroidobacteraceae bacterium]